MDDGRRYSEDRIRVTRVSRRASAEDTRKPTHSVEEGEENRHQYVRSSVEPTEHTQQQETNDEKEAKSKANSRQDKSRATSRQDKSRAGKRRASPTAGKRRARRRVRSRRLSMRRA